MVQSVFLVIAGGGLGSGTRYLVSALLPHHTGRFPVSTLIVNIAGSFILGGLSSFSVIHSHESRTVLLFLGTGFCGGFTTMSTFSAEAIQLFQSGHLVLASTYIIASVCGSIISALLGMAAMYAIYRQ